MENVTSLVTTNFTEKHESISESFLKRVTQMLQTEGISIKNYGIDLEHYTGEVETLKLMLGDKVTIQLSVATRRS